MNPLKVALYSHKDAQNVATADLIEIMTFFKKAP